MWEIAGIVVGSIFVIIVIVGCAFLYFKRGKASLAANEENTGTAGEDDAAP